MQKVKIKSFGFHPIGSFFITENAASPASLFGGTWEKLPEGYALWTAASGAGGTIAAGLPNITGALPYIRTAFGNLDALKSSPSGAFKCTNAGSELVGNGSYTSVAWGNYELDVSRNGQDQIYGKTNTVQPPAYKAYVWKRVA